LAQAAAAGGGLLHGGPFWRLCGGLEHASAMNNQQ